MSRIDVLRASVRPICNIYCTIILGILVLLHVLGHPLPSEGSGAVIVNAFIGLTVSMNLEYSAERGILKYISRKKAKK